MSGGFDHCRGTNPAQRADEALKRADAAPSTRARRALYAQLVPEAWPVVGLSPVNRVVCAAILLSTILAILETEDEVVNAAPAGLIAALELAFGLLFAMEYIARVLAAGEEERYQGILGRLRYMVTPLAIIDVLAIAPFFVFYGTSDTMVLRIFRLLRILRLARLGQLSVALNHFATAARSRRYELGLSGGLAVVILLFSSTLMYVFESASQPQAFGSIPRARWWSIATLTTVGYGDVYPVTPAGKLLAGITAISAIGLIAMPTGILAAAFSEAFQRHREAREQGRGSPGGADGHSHSRPGG
jgi:voltage-gated potassium channel